MNWLKMLLIGYTGETAVCLKGQFLSLDCPSDSVSEV